MTILPQTRHFSLADYEAHYEREQQEAARTRAIAYADVEGRKAQQNLCCRIADSVGSEMTAFGVKSPPTAFEVYCWSLSDDPQDRACYDWMLLHYATHALWDAREEAARKEAARPWWRRRDRLTDYAACLLTLLLVGLLDVVLCLAVPGGIGR